MRVSLVRWRVWYVVLATSTLGSCSSDSAEPSPTDSTDDFVRALPSWSEFSPPLADADDIVAPASSSVSGT